MTNRELTREFARGNTKPAGRSLNMSYDGDELKSYHTVIAKRFKTNGSLEPGEKYAWVTSRNYSVTTARHKGLVRVALAAEGYRVITAEECPTNRLSSLRTTYKKQETKKAQDSAAHEARRVAREARKRATENTGIVGPVHDSKAQVEHAQEVHQVDDSMPPVMEPQSDTDKGFSTKE